MKKKNIVKTDTVMTGLWLGAVNIKDHRKLVTRVPMETKQGRMKSNVSRTQLTKKF